MKQASSSREFSEELIWRIRERVGSDESLTRTELSREVCRWQGWRGEDGRLKEMSCRVGLNRLAQRGEIELPRSRGKPGGNRPRESEVEEPVVFEGTLAQLGKISLVVVEGRDKELSKRWWSMMRRYHPLGVGSLCGAQLRYLVMSEAGVLGGLSFSAAAWRLVARDEWIGWDDGRRVQGLAKIVANSRFLILPTVQVPHLASHVLGAVLRRLGRDWQVRYGSAPVLVESFVDATRYQGTCYRAANFQYVGRTRGRGRQDRQHRVLRTPKDVWVYVLRKDWREQLCGVCPAPARARVELGDWAQREFGGCALETRLQKRLVSLARDFYARPQANVARACASRAKTKAAYRFLDHEETSMQTLLAAHSQATETRLARERIVLAVQDTTSLDYTTHRAMQGIGPVGGWVDGPQGLHLHSTLTFTPEGVPLGFLDAQCWARDPGEFGKKVTRRERPIEQKESLKWLRSFRAVAAVQQRLGNTTLVSVGDREADLYELFREATAHPLGPKLLVRAMHDRSLQNEQARLWPTLQAQPLAGQSLLQVPRQGKRAARVACLEVRFAAFRLQPPQRDHRLAPAIPVWAVLAQEVAVPEGEKPLQWLLLTTLPVTTIAQAHEKLQWYSRRWGIEVMHRTLKSGCRIEQRQLATADRLEAALAIDLVVAWRICFLTHLGRETPEAPCTVYFEDSQWKALMVFTTQQPLPPAQPPTLREAIRRVASLGGFLGRRHDGEPGTQSLWLGLQRLDDITHMWLVVTNATQRPVSSHLNYG